MRSYLSSIISNTFGIAHQTTIRPDSSLLPFSNGNSAVDPFASADSSKKESEPLSPDVRGNRLNTGLHSPGSWIIGEKENDDSVTRLPDQKYTPDKGDQNLSEERNILPKIRNNNFLFQERTERNLSAGPGTKNIEQSSNTIIRADMHHQKDITVPRDKYSDQTQDVPDKQTITKNNLSFSLSDRISSGGQNAFTPTLIERGEVLPGDAIFKPVMEITSARLVKPVSPGKEPIDLTIQENEKEIFQVELGKKDRRKVTVNRDDNVLKNSPKNITELNPISPALPFNETVLRPRARIEIGNLTIEVIREQHERQQRNTVPERVIVQRVHAPSTSRDVGPILKVSYGLGQL